MNVLNAIIGMKVFYLHCIRKSIPIHFQKRKRKGKSELISNDIFLPAESYMRDYPRRIAIGIPASVTWQVDLHSFCLILALMLLVVDVAMGRFRCLSRIVMIICNL